MNQNSIFDDKIILIDKQAGNTSFDTIAQLRRKLRIKKIGHSGTLDRLASGLLVMATGRATKLTRYFLDSDKQYSAEVQLGLVTDTLDADGEIVERNVVSAEHFKKLAQVLLEFKGVIEQVPPLYSALKIDGKRASDRVRNGETLTLEPRKITINSLELDSCDSSRSTFTIRVQCSKGTYIRSLARDIGLKLGCGASIKELRRTASGIFSIENAIKVADLNESANEFPYVIPMDAALIFMNQIVVDEDVTTKVLNGAKFSERSLLSVDNRGSEYSVISNGKMILAIAKIDFSEWHVSYLNVFN